MDGEVKPGAQLGKYRLERLLGRGGMGEVWEAHDPDLDRRVALKLLHARIAGRDDARARFQREGRAMARLRHENVIAVHDATFSGNRGVIAMELVNGENLASWASKPRDPNEIVRVILAAGRGLAAAHAAGMVHRDFKPHNVLIDRDGRVLVTDFGLARARDLAEEVSLDPTGFARTDPPETTRSWGPEESDDPELDETVAPSGLEETAAPSGLEATAAPGSLDETAAAEGATVGTEAPTPSNSGSSSKSRPRIRSAESAAKARDQLATPLTETGSLLGTPAYMAPEQIAGDTVDERSDVFAFCVTAWELFAGVRPFPAESLDEILVAVKANVPTSEGKVPRSLRAILRRGFAWEPKARWQRIDDVLRAIERAQSRPRRVAIGGGAVLAVGATVAIVMATRTSAKTQSVCEDPNVAILSAWSPKIRADFMRTLDGKPYKDAVLTFFDRWGRVWTSTYADNCKHPKDPEFGPRRECLESIRNEVALTTEHSDTLPPEMWSLPDLPRLIAPPETCAFAPRSLAPAPPPPELRDAVAKIRIELASARVPIFTQSIVALGVDVKPQIDAAIATNYKPVIAEAKLVGALAAYFKAVVTKTTPTCDEFDDALEVAESIGYDRMVVEILLLVHECVDSQDGRQSEAAAVLARLVRITERIRNPFQGAIVDIKLADDAIEAGAIERAMSHARAAGKAMEELDVDLWRARAVLYEVDAMETRHAPGDLERAAILLDDKVARDSRSVKPAAIARQRATNAWYRGATFPPTPLEPDDGAVPLRVRVRSNGALVVGALVGTSGLPIADAHTRPLLVEALTRGATGSTGADGIVELSAKRGALVIVRHEKTMGVAVVPAKGDEVDVALAPTIAIGGTTTGVHDRPAGDPTDLAGRSRRRGLARVVLATEIGGLLFQIHAPVGQDGRWSANVPAGKYLVALQAPSGLDPQAAQQVVDVRTDTDVPSLALSATPTVVEVVVRGKSAVSAVAYVSRAGDPLPATWAQLRSALRASPSLTGNEVTATGMEDRDTKRGDVITRLSIPGTPSVLCALPGWRVATDEPMAIVSGPDDQPPLCLAIPEGADRVIIGR